MWIPRLSQRCLEHPRVRTPVNVDPPSPRDFVADQRLVDVTMQQPPGPSGLYDPRQEHDSCGVSFVANLKGVRSNELVVTGLQALTNLEHRGATGAEPDSGDGAGILLQIPDRFFQEVTDFDLPAAGAYAVGIAFLPAVAEHAESSV